MAASGEKEREALAAEFHYEIEARTAALARVAPNLKALEQFQAVKVLPSPSQPTVLPFSLLLDLTCIFL